MIYELYKHSDHSKKTLEEYIPKYDFCQIDLTQAMDMDYWHSLSIELPDMVVLDIHYSKYQGGEKGDVGVGMAYNGKDVVRLLKEAKKKGFCLGLERVLIATSDEKEVNPKSPAIEFFRTDEFDVYGLVKGVSSKSTTPVSYERSLVERIESIYADPAQATFKPLNYAWKNRLKKR